MRIGRLMTRVSGFLRLSSAVAVAVASLAANSVGQEPGCCGGLREQREPIGISFGGVAPKPDVPWFLVPQNGSSQADQPPVSGVATHANLTRFWSAAAASSNYRVVLPPGQTTASLVSATMPGVSASIAPANGYTWADFITAVDNTFAKFVNCSTAQVPPTTNLGIVNANYLFPATNLPTSVLTNPLGVWTTTLGGPTGNGINEIILTNQPAIANSIGLCSMNVSSSGAILEADVILYAPSLFQTVSGGASTALPEHWTALTHEIGHYFGLDHTNLHPGSAPAAPLAPSTNFTLSTGTAAVFPAAATVYPNGSVWVPIPAMVGVITHLGGAFDFSTVPLHPDDQTSLSKIYPVLLPNLSGGVNRVPLINNFGRIIGRQNSLTAPIFGRNVWADGDLRTIGIPGTLGYPTNGTISGTSRLDATEPAGFFLNNTVYSRPANHVVSGYMHTAVTLPGIDMMTISPLLSPSTASVVGSSLPGGLRTSGDFSIDGLVPGYGYDVVFENAGLLGATGGNLAEWFSGAGSFTNPYSGAPFNSTRLTSSTGQLFGVLASSMLVGPGTVIALDPLDNDEANVNLLGQSALFDTYSRPLVTVTPRDGRSAAGVTALAIQAYPALGPGTIGVTAINQSSAQLWINGVNQSALLTNPATVVTVAAGNGVVTWSIPIGLVTAGIATSTPINVSFVVSEIDVIGAGFGPYLTFGRNDVVL